jgi:hypothetical protein
LLSKLKDGEPVELTRYIEGFSHFVTSMTAPIISGWGNSCRVGLAPTGKRRLITAHALCSHSLHADELLG